MIRLLINKVPIGYITAPYGDVNSVHLEPHKGIDLYCPIGTELHAPLDGIVNRVVDYGNSSLGKAIFVKLNDGRQFVFGHLSEFKVHAGQVIHKGDLLGISGSTGRSTGGHLHFGAFDKYGHFINPEELFKEMVSSLHTEAINVLANASDYLPDASHSLFHIIDSITNIM